MSNKKIILILISVLAALDVRGQRDSAELKSSEVLIFEIDELINYTRNEIDADDKKNNSKIPQSIKALNNKNCTQLSGMLPDLKIKLYDEYGDIENVKYQIEPFIISLNKCIKALELLTTHDVYVEVEKINYENAFLFKELAKGNLFRAVGEKHARPALFSISVGFGYYGNGMYKTFNNAYQESEWRDESGSLPDFKNENASANLSYAITVDRIVSKRATAGIGFQSLPSVSIRSQAANDTSGGLYDRSSESFSGNAFDIHGAYIVKKRKPSGFGFEITVGGSIQLNNFILERELTTINSVFLYSYIYYYEGPNENIVTDTAEVYDSFYESLNQKGICHSIAFGISISGHYHINKYVSINVMLAQYLDTGIKVDGLNFNGRSLPSYTLKLNSFTARAGLAFHF